MFFSNEQKKQESANYVNLFQIKFHEFPTIKFPLDIRTYAVVPLNEECGIIEWVSNTESFRSIMLRLWKNNNVIVQVENDESLAQKFAIIYPLYIVKGYATSYEAEKTSQRHIFEGSYSNVRKCLYYQPIPLFN
jgi:phosphatidylinositol kinase/protein kinase (PI-3  family)